MCSVFNLLPNVGFSSSVYGQIQVFPNKRERHPSSCTPSYSAGRRLLSQRLFRNSLTSSPTRRLLDCGWVLSSLLHLWTPGPVAKIASSLCALCSVCHCRRLLSQNCSRLDSGVTFLSQCLSPSLTGSQCLLTALLP